MHHGQGLDKGLSWLSDSLLKKVFFILKQDLSCLIADFKLESIVPECESSGQVRVRVCVRDAQEILHTYVLELRVYE